MSASVLLTVTNRFQGHYRGTPGMLNPGAKVALDWVFPFDAGSASGLYADMLYQTTLALAASGSQNIDLTGALVDDFGVSLAIVHVSGIIVTAPRTNIGDMLVGGAASNTFTGPFGAANNTLAVKPGGVVSMVHPGAGWTVTPATGDILKIANADTINAGSVSVLVFGKSA